MGVAEAEGVVTVVMDMMTAVMIVAVGMAVGVATKAMVEALVVVKWGCPSKVRYNNNF